ncbi:MAG: DNA replication/repair protein RecF [Flavobacteriales bacterium]|nr:DNA replication/repair protein RecF [Flavobacteriales bacterium]
MDLTLKSLHLVNFKNHRETRFDFDSRINCITGMNGSGKTNVLEAIYYLSFCKGYFNPQDAQNVLHGEEYFSIRGESDRGGPVAVSCAVQKGQRKRFKKDDKEYERLADHIGSFPVVIISPYDVDLIREGSEERRKFVDMVISLDDRDYLNTIIDYNRALSQRNNLLKYFWANRTMDKTQLGLWNEQLCHLGAKVYARRASFFEEFRPIFKEIQSAVSLGRDDADIHYRSQLSEGDMLPQLEAALDKEMARHHTLVGTHKDDMLMTVNGHAVKKFGSQGQQKTFLIAMKLAQFQFIKAKTGLKPLLLLDDVFDKIDDERVAYMVDLVSEQKFGQIFITDTSKERLGRVLSDIGESYNTIELTNLKSEKVEEG